MQGFLSQTKIAADLAIARARVGLAVVALVSLYVDPSNNGWFDIGAYSLAVLCLYLVYSVLAYVMVRRRFVPPSFGSLSVSAIFDVVFAAAVAMVTEGPTSASWLFFVFAILAVNLRTGFRAGIPITLCCSAVYLVLLIVAAPGREFQMRAAYLAIVGYLIGFFGQENIRLEGAVRDLENERQRHEIARILHDGYIQALASVNLQLDTCRKLLKNDRPTDALVLVEEVQTGVKREYDEVRAFVRSLANISDRMSYKGNVSGAETSFDVSANFRARGMIPEQILQIMVEGMRNVREHASADRSTITVAQVDRTVHIAIDDDGIGFAQPQSKPWTIASRVDQFGGSLQIGGDNSRGTHIKIELALE